ncbi:MAG: LacI family DNA-binding transcriptional regulator [Notoacmeibacter sp.]
MLKRPTIIEVAEKAGVSKSTVSLVLQNSPLVKEETRALVRDAMAAIGYVYNRAAANLRSSNVGLIGLVINDLRNPFFTEFATSAQMAFSARGYATVIANTDEDPALQAQVVGSMIEHGVSALVISPTYGLEDATFGALQRAGIPTMQVLRKVDPRLDLFPFSSHDYASGSQAAARHLLNMGAKNIAFIGGFAERAITQERMSGYRSVLQQAGMAPFAFHGRPTRAFGHDAAIELAKTHPDIDAALCFNDLVALGMLSGFARLGRNIGQDFRLVGFDDIEECAQVWPQLTSVRCDIAHFANQTAHDLLQWLEHDKQPAPESRAAVDLIIRTSSSGEHYG